MECFISVIPGSGRHTDFCMPLTRGLDPEGHGIASSTQQTHLSGVQASWSQIQEESQLSRTAAERSFTRSLHFAQIPAINTGQKKRHSHDYNDVTGQALLWQLVFQSLWLKRCFWATFTVGGFCHSCHSSNRGTGISPYVLTSKQQSDKRTFLSHPNS